MRRSIQVNCEVAVAGVDVEARNSGSMNILCISVSR